MTFNRTEISCVMDGMDGIPLHFGCIDHRATILESNGNEAAFYVVPWNTIGHELREHLNLNSMGYHGTTAP